MRYVRGFVLGLVALATPVSGQDTAVVAALAPLVRASVPFGIGERADYSVKYGPFSVGSGVMEIVGIDTIRGRESWHTLFRIRGGIPGFRVNDRMESWMDTHSLASLRHWQELDEGPNERERRFEIYPESVYVQNGQEPQPTVTLPLDDGSFLYFLRTIPLEVGQEYSFDRYFRPDRNPVRFHVLRRETITVPAGTFATVVVRPIINARGVFSENGRAEVWLTDDCRRIMVQLKSHMKLGSLSLFLKSFTPAKISPDSTTVAKQR